MYSAVPMRIAKIGHVVLSGAIIVLASLLLAGVRFPFSVWIAVCGALPEADPQETVDRLRELQPAGREQTSGRVQPIDREWIAVPSPLLCPESAETLRAADVVLLAVPAGATVGKRLEAVLEYLTAQDCKVDGAFLWNADETLIRSYYFLPMIGSDTADNDMNTRNTEMEHTKTTQAEGEQA